MKYVLTLEEDQAAICAVACEFYARIRMGQFNEIVNACMMDQPLDNTWCVRRDDAERLLLEARARIYPELRGPGHSYGIAKFDDADASFDIYQALRQKFPHDGRTPFSYHKLPKCEVLPDGDK